MGTELVPYSFNTAMLPRLPQYSVLLSQTQGVSIALVSPGYQFILNKIIGWFADRDEVSLINHGISDKTQGGYIILEWTECEVDQLFLAILGDEETVVDYTVYTRDLQ